jgi:putative transposase
VDKGPEFTSRVPDQWAYCNQVQLGFVLPGKPTDNAVNEAFNSRFRQECLDEHWFLSVAGAQEKVEAWWQLGQATAISLWAAHERQSHLHKHP